MAVLAPSLRRLFNEVDRRWPNRDRRTDGWLCGGYCGQVSEHYPDHKGMVHAIDIDIDGLDWRFFVDHIHKDPRVLWYVIVMRQIWSSTRGFAPRIYTGFNPHIDHIHVSIHLTDVAENFSGGWGIAVPGVSDRLEPAGPNYISHVGITGWDWRQPVDNVATNMHWMAYDSWQHAHWIAGM